MVPIFIIPKAYRANLIFFSKPCREKIPNEKMDLQFVTDYTEFRGTQRPFSVKYLFGEANIAQNFLLLEDG